MYALIHLRHERGNKAATEVVLEERVWPRGVAVSGVGLINEVNRHWARLVLGWVTVCGRRAGEPFRYVTSHLGQLSLPSLRGR